MKTRIREVIDYSVTHKIKRRYICEYNCLYFFWKPCNTIWTNFPGPTYREGYNTRKQAEKRIEEFLLTGE